MFYTPSQFREKFPLSDYAYIAKIISFAITHGNENLLREVKSYPNPMNHTMILRNFQERFNAGLNEIDADLLNLGKTKVTQRLMGNAIKSCEIPVHDANFNKNYLSFDEQRAVYSMSLFPELFETAINTVFPQYMRSYPNSIQDIIEERRAQERPVRLAMTEYALALNNPSMANAMLTKPYFEVEAAFKTRNLQVIELGQAALYTKLYQNHLLNLIITRLQDSQCLSDEKIVTLCDEVIKMERYIIKIEAARQEAVKAVNEEKDKTADQRKGADFNSETRLHGAFAHQVCFGYKSAAQRARRPLPVPPVKDKPSEASKNAKRPLPVPPVKDKPNEASKKAKRPLPVPPAKRK